jgi:hypothetical protein
MIDELAPLSLTEAARRLGTTPFDLVRIAVAHGEMPTGPMRFDASRLQRLAATGAFGNHAPGATPGARTKAAAEQPR